jgi:hypothetical protein
MPVQQDVPLDYLRYLGEVFFGWWNLNVIY